MSAEIEAVIWCPSCRVSKFEILRVPTGNEGVYRHIAEPKERAGVKYCECGTPLERKS